MQRDLDRIMISRQRIAERITELGREITTDLANLTRAQPSGEVVLLPVLTGSVVFVADLMRQLDLKVRLHMVTISSYPGASTNSQGARLEGQLPDDLSGRHVLIVDDILDSGGTIRLLREEIDRRSPLSLKACVLLRKKIESALATPCDYVGFDIPDEFVVGYGLDYDGYYRNLPDIAVLKPPASRGTQDGPTP